MAKQLEAALAPIIDPRPQRSRQGRDAARTRKPLLRRGRRSPGLLDPFQAAVEGETTLRQALAQLDIEQLKDIVAEHGMDSSNLALKWKRSDRLIELIVSTVHQRSRKGEAFRGHPYEGPATTVNQDRLGHQLREIAFAAFEKTGNWPTVRQVYLATLRQGVALQLHDVNQFFIHHSGAMSEDSPTSLNVRDLLDIERAGWLLKEFVQVAVLCARRLMREPVGAPKFSSKDVRKALSLEGKGNDLHMRQLHSLLRREVFLTAGGHSNSDGTDWEYDVGPNAHMFRNIDTVDDYLAIAERLSNPVDSLTSRDQPQQEKSPIGLRRSDK